MPRSSAQIHDDLTVSIVVKVNGELVSARVEPRLHLVDFLRGHLGLTGTHIGCEHGVCGACSVRVNGQIVRGCLMLAVQAADACVETIEHVADSGEIDALQEAFLQRNALQCGYCTPGMLLTAAELLRAQPRANRAQIRAYLSGNYCRCSGYQAIVDAIECVITERSDERSEN